MGPNQGEKAPNFKLKASVGGEIMELELYEELKKDDGEGIVLAFFPLAFSSGCTKELCQFRDSLSEFEDLDAKVFGISVDSHYALKAFAKENDLQFPLLSDFNREVINDYAVVHHDLNGLKDVAKRSVFVLNGEGKVVYKWISDDPSILPDQEKVKEALGKI